MASKRGKRRLKKEFLLILVTITVLLMFVFTNVVKVISNNSINNNKDKTNIELNKDNKNDDKKELTSENIENESVAKRPVIIIDPAFGGEYAGSKGVNGILQKDVNLNIALNVQKTLKRYSDIDVYLTRETDVTVSYEKRIDLIKEKKADVVVSIQQNTEGTKTAEGVETYVLSKNDYPNSDSSLGYSIQKAMTTYSTTKDRGVMARNTDILKDSYKNGATGALIYTGFITNESEGKKLTTDSYVEKLGEGIAQGILSYIDKKRAVSE